MLSLMMLIYVMLIIILLFSKQTRRWPTWPLRATWCIWALCW